MTRQFWKKELPMAVVPNVGEALHRLFGEIAETAAQESQVIQRTRKCTSLSSARTFIPGFLQNPKASDDMLARMAVQCGANVTPQAVEQRYTPRLVDFLERVFRCGTQMVGGGDKTLAPILERFPCVDVIDSSSMTLPEEMQVRFRGCGGRSGSGAAALKLQTELDLRSGVLKHVEIDEGRRPDGRTIRQAAPRGSGVLRITDPGDFALPVFATMAAAGEYSLSRWQIGTHVLHEGLKMDVLP